MPIGAFNPFALFGGGQRQQSRPAPGGQSRPASSIFSYDANKYRIQPGELPITYAPRAIFEFPGRVSEAVVSDLAQGAQTLIGEAFTPHGGGGWPQKFDDPKWDALEQQIAGAEAPLLKAIRTRGERTNTGVQNARTGANTPYQITAKTRQGIIKNHGFDPWASPENAVKGAAIVLRDHGGAAKPENAVGGYFGGARGARNPFDMTVGDGNLKIGEYVSKVLGDNLINPFDPRYLNAARAQVNRAERLAMQPFSASFRGDGPMPAMPKPEPSPKTDFSAAETNLEQLRPVEMALKEQHDIKWKNFWSGLGQAMANSREGEGLGSFLMRLAGGVIAGKGAAMDEIQQRKDLYETKLAKWQAAMYEHNFQKAQMMQNELETDWQANQQHVQQNYRTALALWEKNSTPQITGDGSRIVFTKINPSTGQTDVSMTPVGPAIQADFALKRANLAMQAFGEQNQANAQVAGLHNRVQSQLVMAQAAQVMTDQNASQTEKAAAAVQGIMSPISYAVETQQVPAIIGEKQYEQLNEEVTTQLNGAGLAFGSKEYNEAYQRALVGRLLGAALGDEATFSRLMQSFGAASNIYDTHQQLRRRTERTREGPKGTTREVTNVFEAE